MKKSIQLFFLLLVQLHLFCQYEIIPLSTTSELNYVSSFGDSVIVGGISLYLAKGSKNLNDFVLLPPPTSQTSSFSTSYKLADNTIFSFCVGGSTCYIYKTTDNGLNWDLKYNSDSILGIGFHMFDSLNGIMLGLLNKCLITNDGGETWFSRNLFSSFPSSYKVYGDSTICAANMDGFSISDDMGMTWSGHGVLGFSGIQKNFHFLNKDTIYSVTQPPAWDGFLAYSYDHGGSWTNIYFEDENQIKPVDVYFFSTLEGYVCGLKNATYATIMKTLDGGQNWETFNSGIENTFLNMTFINDSIALLGGYDGLLVSWNKNSEQAEVLNIQADKLGIDLYPNPAKDIQRLEIQTKGFQQIKIVLMDASGKEIKKVFEGNVNGEKFTLSNDVSKLKAGVYFYKVKLDKLLKTIQFVKE